MHIKETMTRRQRVLAAINHETPDRVPIDLGVHFSTGISAFAYKHLREYLNLDEKPIEIVDTVQMLARVHEDVLERFHCDTLLLNPPPKHPAQWHVRDDYKFILPESSMPARKANGDWIFERDNQHMRMPSGGYFFDGAWLMPQEYKTEEEEFNAYAASAERIYKETDYFTMQMGFGGYFPGLDFACLMLTDPDEAQAWQKGLHEHNLAKFKKILPLYGKYIQCIELNADLGAQNGPLFRPQLFEDFCLPYMKAFISYVHDNSDIKVFLHSCGAMEPFIPYLIEAGVDILNPIQLSAANMDAAALKEKYGKQICFWGGGCDTQNILPTASTDEIITHVQDMIHIFAPGGGFVFNQVHNIMGDIAPDKIVAMFDAAYITQRE
ncbi:MAG: hypothetical protein FWC71_03490 [Defluviitaleaceae bacterium]|nr:hypothetical protein [Defluviitaleaceae bacterium]